ncbi:MAG: hypothetical protein EDQ89_01975 [Acidobacteria bacterium]|nr:MAG: hypothetical protein EDQ89_01975 [Acidobacteriota bacterium]
MARSAALTAVLALMTLGSAATATAAQRYAAPAGTGPAATCPESDPCDLDTAVEDASVVDDDEVIVTPGTYTIASLEVTDDIDLHGQASQPPPTINASGSPGILIADAATVRDLRVEAASFQALHLFAAGALVERVSGHAAGGGGTACSVSNSVTIRDSLCWNSGMNSRGVGANLSTFAGTYTARLRNVTAVGTTNGLGFDYSGTGVDFTIDAKNVIADGGSPFPLADVRATSAGGAATTVTLANSNYSTEFESTNPDGTSASVTDPGTGTNQTAPPLFVDAGAGDFHQQAGSPTIDAGVLDGFTGTGDFDGDARSLEGNGVCPTAPDIGADELVGSPIDCDPPETTIAGGPTGVTADPTPTSDLQSDEPSSTFECRIDAGSFAACATPYTTPSLSDPPETTIAGGPTGPISDPTPTFNLQSDEPSSTFECRIDAGSFAACATPYTTPSLSARPPRGRSPSTPTRRRRRSPIPRSGS